MRIERFQLDVFQINVTNTVMTVFTHGDDLLTSEFSGSYDEKAAVEPAGLHPGEDRVLRTIVFLRG